MSKSGIFCSPLGNYVHLTSETDIRMTGAALTRKTYDTNRRDK
jgi:hypothetical protein